jgi:hypothetical protein
LIKSSWFIIMLTTLLIGCAPIMIKGNDNTVHYVILGLGIVSIPGGENKIAVQAAKTNTLGMSFTNQPGTKFSLGYTSGFFVAIPDHAKDVRVEIYEFPGKPITLDAISAELKSNPEEEASNDRPEE